MNIFRLILPKKRPIGELLRLKKYRILREEAYRLYEKEKEAAKLELDTATSIPISIYQKRIEAAHQDFVRVEEELWTKYMGIKDE